MEAKENKIYEICCMQETMISALKAELSKGLEHADAKELGEAADIIKDLAEAECKLRESCYYKTVVEAMEEGSEENESYGYTKRPRPRTPTHWKPMISQEPYIEDYLENETGRYLGDMRMGYVEGDRPMRHEEGPHKGTDSRYGQAYREYQSARRHYTTTNSPTDKDAMTTHATEHVADTIATIRDIWRNADTDLKKRMKTDFQNLISEMTV